MKKLIVLLFLSFTTFFAQSEIVLTGADLITSKQFDHIKGKKLGIVTNHSALLLNKVHLIDALFQMEDVKIIALFGPEHGIRGDAPDGNTITHGKDSKTGIPVYSLYGEIRKPTKEMLKDIDVLVFDIQDVGVRFYTYISTLFYTMQAAAENNIPVIVLDRPNPITEIKIDGPVRKEELTSFVGIAPIPIMHGMTVCELAVLFNESGLLGNNLKANLKTVKMENWKRSYYFNDCSLNWIKPSPNIPDVETAVVYPGTCLIEGTNVSEGRGTQSPFLTIGAPYINSQTLIDQLNKMDISGVTITAVDFTPVDIANMATNPKHENKVCHGISINVTDRNVFEPVKFGVKLVSALHSLFPDDFKFSDSRFDRLSGDKIIREQIQDNTDPEKIIAGWQNELNQFIELRTKYLLY